jgi:hypothetical protein
VVKKSQCLILSRISVAAFLGTQKKLARSTRRARRFLEGMSLPNPKNDNKGRAICILNPDGIPSHSSGLAEGLPLGNGFSNVATRRHCCCPDYRGLKPTATINCRDATIWRKLFRAELSWNFMPNWPSSDLRGFAGVWSRLFAKLPRIGRMWGGVIQCVVRGDVPSCHQKCRNPYRIDLKRGGRCPRVGLRPTLFCMLRFPFRARIALGRITQGNALFAPGYIEMLRRSIIACSQMSRSNI